MRYNTLFLRLLLLSIFLLVIPALLPAGQNIPGQITVHYARGFQVEYRDGVTLVSVTNPWPGAKTGFRYLLNPSS